MTNSNQETAAQIYKMFKDVLSVYFTPVTYEGEVALRKAVKQCCKIYIDAMATTETSFNYWQDIRQEIELI